MSSSSVPGTNVPPVSFPGISSGIDYNAIITKLTSLTLAPVAQLNHQLATLNAANTELIKINNLFACVQSALGTLSDPGLFSAYNATSSNISVATAQGIPSATAVAGTYTINCASVATATSVTSSTTVGHNINDIITSGVYSGSSSSNSAPLIDSYAAITPSNGSGTAGSITVDGQTVSYNVNTDTLNMILNRIQTAVDTNYDPSFTISAATGTIQISGSKTITLGNATDKGNLLQVLKLDQAQINNVAFTVSGTSGVGGLNQGGAFNDATTEGFITPVTSGTFTINGVAITVSASGDNLASVLAKINASAAGVNATYNAALNEITLTSTTTGPQSIVVGAAGDTSNFLSAAGLTTAAGATTSVGAQSYVQLRNPNGSVSNIYGSSNTITSAIPGVQLTLISSTSTPFTVAVSANTSNLVGAINSFVSAYNAAIGEINQATSPPVVVPEQPGTASSTANKTIGGGVLWGNSDISNLKNELANMVAGFFGSGNGYNSLASIGLSLSDSFSVVTTSNNGQQNGGSNSGTANATVQSTSYQGTDGTLQPLNTSKLLAALTANPTEVEAIFNGANSLTTQVGTYLTGVTGFPTLLNSGTVGNVPTTSILTAFENTNSNNITNLQQQIKQITNNANMQANMLRAEFVNTETQLAGFQALQSQLAGFFKSSGS